MIQEKVNEEFDKVYTFTPQTNDKSNKRRFEEFLNDQMNHAKRLNEKLQNLKNENDRKNYFDSCPKISEKSKRIFEQKMKTDLPVYMRLYQSKIKDDKKELKTSNTKSVRPNI